MNYTKPLAVVTPISMYQTGSRGNCTIRSQLLLVFLVVFGTVSFEERPFLLGIPYIRSAYSTACVFRFPRKVRPYAHQNPKINEPYHWQEIEHNNQLPR